MIKGIFCNFFINIGIFISMQFKEGLAKAFFIACGVIVFVFMGYEHVVFNAGLYAGMMFFNMDGLSWLGVLKNIVLHSLETISVEAFYWISVCIFER